MCDRYQRLVREQREAMKERNQTRKAAADVAIQSHLENCPECGGQVVVITREDLRQAFGEWVEG